MQIAASQFPEILVSDIMKTVAKQFRESASVDAPASSWAASLSSRLGPFAVRHTSRFPRGSH